MESKMENYLDRENRKRRLELYQRFIRDNSRQAIHVWGSEEDSSVQDIIYELPLPKHIPLSNRMRSMVEGSTHAGEAHLRYMGALSLEQLVSVAEGIRATLGYERPD